MKIQKKYKFFKYEMQKEKIIQNCKELLQAYKEWKLWYMEMPKNSKPEIFKSQEEKLVYFTLPMSLNYQRNSYSLWEWVLKSYQDADVAQIFSIETSAKLSEDELREKLLKHKIALQSNKHINTWMRISQTIYENWGTIENLLEVAEYDFLKLKNILQNTHKKGFPYLSWPKIFHYWCLLYFTELLWCQF